WLLDRCRVLSWCVNTTRAATPAGLSRLTVSRLTGGGFYLSGNLTGRRRRSSIVGSLPRGQAGAATTPSRLWRGSIRGAVCRRGRHDGCRWS
ncbi:MAG: hypothetical protein ACXWP0_18105, partial [Ktedonobacterales bacterium]